MIAEVKQVITITIMNGTNICLLIVAVNHRFICFISDHPLMKYMRLFGAKAACALKKLAQ